MMYVSTRGGSEKVDFLAASLAGLAPDGGLYCPETYPAIAPPSPFEGYVVLAARVMQAFAGDTLSPEIVRGFAERAYAPFAHQSVAPLVQVGAGRWMLELHHGPTLAFKDVAMRMIAQLYDYVLGQRDERMTILCATSGDTGGAAASAFAGASNIDVVILHPEGRVSPTQRIFMTSTGASNIHNLALQGDFDGTQAILKTLMTDADLKKRSGLAAVNSINWVRVAAQSVYFAQVQAQLGAGRHIRFVVPTGNFGDALAGYVAYRCGLLSAFDCVAAVNANDAMVRLLDKGVLSKGETHPTLSPAMDIQAPSNFERFLFEATGRDAAAVASVYAGFAETGEARLPQGAPEAMKQAGLRACAVSDAETTEEMRRTLSETGWLVCPHTAVGLSVARREAEDCDAIVTLATAHAAKFPETVEEALGVTIGLPSRAGDILSREEVYETGPMSADYVRDRIDRIVREQA
ncbi:MAG: threonine synthase [Hyphomonadaceae bacterium]